MQAALFIARSQLRLNQRQTLRSIQVRARSALRESLQYSIKSDVLQQRRPHLLRPPRRIRRFHSRLRTPRLPGHPSSYFHAGSLGAAVVLNNIFHNQILIYKTTTREMNRLINRFQDPASQWTRQSINLYLSPQLTPAKRSSNNDKKQLSSTLSPALCPALWGNLGMLVAIKRQLATYSHSTLAPSIT